MTPAREPSEVAAIAEALARAELVTFDLEFLAQDRLIPTLCLVQVSWVEHRELDADGREIVAPPRIALVDPLAVDVGPVVQALAAHPRVVAHAARQDLWVLAARFGAVVPGLVDTQVMAAFAGIGDQVGLAALANELLGLQLGKELQWTDWGTRPLSPAQLAYAADDVRHLPAIYGLLAKRLANRMPWAVAESAGVMSDALAAASVTPETAWRHVGGLRGIDADTHAAVVALAAWRQRVAIELDRPLGQIVNDKILVELARTRPSDPDAVRAHKGVTRLARDRAADILAAISAAEPAKEPHAIRPWRAASLHGRSAGPEVRCSRSRTPSPTRPGSRRVLFRSRRGVRAGRRRAGPRRGGRAPGARDVAARGDRAPVDRLARRHGRPGGRHGGTHRARDHSSEDLEPLRAVAPSGSSDRNVR
ncbi:MAG: HRDC domain-containing protein [Deltaproteobacteria bacterium]|nr:HRDC domain-containing protein [Deltaproteobacteria bacterium]